jgi:polyisoprenoid-binding protein YceI
MKHVARLFSLAAVALLATVATSIAAPRTYTFDRAHSEVGFNVRHFFNKTHGRFENYKGTLVFDEANLAGSSVELTIQDSSIYTANERRDNHLRTEDFFWVEKYPTVTFKSTKVIPGKTKDHFQVQGDLTIRGITKPVTLEVDYYGMGPVAIAGNNLGTQAGFNATTTVNRKDFGIVWNKQLDSGGVMLGEDVEIVLSIAAISRDEPPAGAAPKKS